MTNSVTVLLPVYNGQLYLAESIESILQQTFSNFELLIIDDGSTDSSAAIINKYKDSRIRFIQHEQNQGLIATLNHGLAEARHELIARHDQDDIAFPDRLLIQTNFMDNHPDVGVCGGGAYILMNQKHTQKILFPSSDIQIRWALLFYSPLIHPSVMYRRSIVQQVSGYSTADDANYTEDYELWIKLQPYTKFYNIHRPLLELRKHGGNMTIANENYHILQTTNVTKKYIDSLLGYAVPVNLICWLRNFPEATNGTRDRAKFLLHLYKKFTALHPMSFRDWSGITRSFSVHMLRALRSDLVARRASDMQ